VLRWFEPRPALAAQGETIDARVELRASVHDCVNLARAAAAAAHGHVATRRADIRLEVATETAPPRLPVPDMSDADLLAEFIVVHWAEEAT
jgi:hypothetical protein